MCASEQCLWELWHSVISVVNGVPQLPEFFDYMCTFLNFFIRCSTLKLLAIISIKHANIALGQEKKMEINIIFFVSQTTTTKKTNHCFTFVADF